MKEKMKSLWFSFERVLPHNILKRVMILFAGSVLLISCKQTFVIHEIVQIDKPATETSLMDFIQTSILDWSFALWLVAFSLLLFYLRMNGYSLLRWFKGRPFSSKVVIIFLILAIIYTIGCIPQQGYGGWFALPVMAIFYSSFAVIKSIVKRYQFYFKNTNTQNSIPDIVRYRRNLRLLGRVIIWVWSGGWFLYFLAIGIAQKPHVGAEVLWRSAIASLNLFLTSIDSTIIDDIQGHDILKGLISCVGFSAVLCTVALILSLVLYRLRAYLHIKHIQINNEHNHLYVFFGMNDASKLLADSVYNEDPQSVIVYVESSQNNKFEQENDKIDGWKNLVNLLIHRRKAFIDADENERRALTISNCDICNLELDTKDAIENDVLGNIGVESVKRLIQGLKSVNDPQLHVFFLSEDRETNVQSTAILAKDDLIGAKEFQTTIYCHARRNTTNRVIEDLGIGTEKRIDVRILDSSHLAIEHLKRNVKNHPINFVKVSTLQDNNPGTVSTDFVSLVMGFGETGQEAVKFLYEYGAFIHENASEKNSRRSPFHCYVIDKEMKTLEGPFISDVPSAECKKCGERIERLINFYPYDYRSDDFFTKVLKPIADRLNYVVVAIGDDEKNMTVAVEILRFVRKYRGDLENFCIYVRAYEKGTFKYLTDIATHYNLRLETVDKKDEKKIILFGQNEQIYTYKLVIKDEYYEKGKLYYDTYRSLQLDPDSDRLTWEERREKEMGKTQKTKWERMSSIKRKESQDRSNALHAKTKIMLLEKAVGKDNAKEFALKALEEREKKDDFTISYPQLNKAENCLMLNLAKCEHLRWNAAHEMLGYINNTTDEHRCNEMKRRHNCLKDWQDLDAESRAVDYIDNYKLFDFGVVETTFKMEYLSDQQ